MVVGDDVAAPPAGDDRHVEQLRELHEVGRAAGAQHAGAGEDDRPLRAGEELEHGADVVGRRARGAAGRPATRRAGRELLVEQVLGERQERRGPDGPSSAARIASSSDVGGRRCGRRARRRTWRGRRTSSTLVDLLERLAAAEPRVDLADEGEHRRRVLAAVWMPIARFAAPTARVPRQAAGRPVSWP